MISIKDYTEFNIKDKDSFFMVFTSKNITFAPVECVFAYRCLST